jgi:hypothetical protein
VFEAPRAGAGAAGFAGQTETIHRSEFCILGTDRKTEQIQSNSPPSSGFVDDKKEKQTQLHKVPAVFFWKSYKSGCFCSSEGLDTLSHTWDTESRKWLGYRKDLAAFLDQEASEGNPVKGSDTIRRMNRRKLLQKIVSGSRNIRFADMNQLVKGFGFELSRTDGSHHIYSRSGIPELINLQAVKGQAKPYQIRQFLKLVEKYDLRLEDE